jgi:hypothetical protein
MKETLRGLVGLFGAVLMILSVLNLILGWINGRLPTRSPDAETIGGHALYLVSYYGFLPAIAGALMYYGRKRR